MNNSHHSNEAQQLSDAKVEKLKIHESPDKGKTIYEREFGSDPSTRKIVKTSVQQQWEIIK